MTKLRLLSLVLVFAGWLTPAHSAQDTVQEHLRRGKELIEANQFDAMGRTKAGLEAGIQELEKAIALGHESIETYKVLANAYNQMALVYSEAGSAERASYTAKRNTLFKRLYELNPSDPDTLYQYAESLDDDHERIMVYHKLLALAPDRSDARFLLGRLLVLAGQWQEGKIELAKAVLADRDPTSVRTYVWDTLDVLQRRGCALGQAEKWANRIQSIEIAFERAKGDPQVARKDLATFKRQFADVLRRHTCS